MFNCAERDNLTMYLDKRLTILCFFLLIALSRQLSAQINIVVDTVKTDTVLTETETITNVLPSRDTLDWKTNFFQPYVAVYYEQSQNPEGFNESLSAEAGIVCRNNFIVAAFGSKYNGNYSALTIFPNEFDMKYRHGGFQVGYKTDLEKHLDFVVNNKTSFGTVVWQLNGEHFLKDNFMIINPNLGAEFNFSSILRVGVSGGYRWMGGLELTSLSNNDFSGFTGQAYLKVGFFNFWR